MLGKGYEDEQTLKKKKEEAKKKQGKIVLFIKDNVRGGGDKLGVKLRLDIDKDTL